MIKYIIFFIVLIAMAFIYLKVAMKYRILDNPNYRSSHVKPTIRGGGILFLFGLLLFFFWNNFPDPIFISGVFVVAVSSFVDDIFTLSAKIRWPFQLLAVILLFYQIGLEHFPLWTYAPLLILAVGFVNLFNFLDGINGITGFSSMVVLLAFYYLNQDFPVVDDSFLIIIMLSVVVFGYFNFRQKALMFAGDVGSITMAMILFYLGVKYILVTESPLIICLYMVFGADSTLTLFYRIAKREKISTPHRHHIYQKLVDNFKFSHLQVSGMYALLQLVLSLITLYVIYNVDLKYHFAIGLGISQLLTLVYILIFRKNKRRFDNEEK